MKEAVNKYERIFEAKATATARRAAAAIAADGAQDFHRCPVCEQIPDEAHLHGSALFKGGKELF